MPEKSTTKLSKKKIREYVIGEGRECPYCGGSDLHGGSLDMENGGEVTQLIACETCGAGWEDVYKLSTVYVLK